MKLSILFTTGIISLMLIQTEVNAQANSTRLRQSILDSLDKQAVPFAKIKEKYTAMWVHDISAPANFPEEEIVLANGAKATYRTSNNKKVKELLSGLFAISPVDFLLGLRGIKGWISIEPNVVSCVKKKDIPYLIKLAQMDIVSPQIVQDNTRGLQKKPEHVFTPNYFEMPLGINALDLISSYLSDVFPYITPTYESVKTWYDSGKPKEEYKFDSFIPPGKSQFYKPVWPVRQPIWPVHPPIKRN